MWIAQGHASKCTGVLYTAYEFYKALTKPWGVGVSTVSLLARLCVGVKKSKGEDEGVISVVEEG